MQEDGPVTGAARCSCWRVDRTIVPPGGGPPSKGHRVGIRVSEPHCQADRLLLYLVGFLGHSFLAKEGDFFRVGE